MDDQAKAPRPALAEHDEAAARRHAMSSLDALEHLPETDHERVVPTVANLVVLGRWEEVEPWARIGHTLLAADDPALPRLLFYAAVAAFNRADMPTARVWTRRGLALFPDHPDMHFVAMALAAWRCKLGHVAIQDPAHPLHSRVGDSRRWLGAIEDLLDALGMGGDA